MITRINRLVVLSVLAAVLLAACSGGTGTSPAPTAGTSEVAPSPSLAVTSPSAPASQGTPAPKTKVVLWFNGVGAVDLYPKFVDEIVKPFNDSNPSYEVVPEIVMSIDVIRTALAAGAGPDVVMTEGPTTGLQMALAGWLLPLDKYSEQYQWPSQFAPWALSLGKSDGTLFNLPTEVETELLYYNKTLFASHGWQPPTTMDQLTALAAQVKSAGIIPFASTNREFRKTNGHLLTPILNSVAGPDKVKAALQGKIKWTDPAFASAVDLLTTYMTSDYVMGGLTRYYSTTIAERDAAIATGKAAMMISGSWEIAQLITNFKELGQGSDWDWVPIPPTTGQPSYVLGVGTTWAINKNAENPDGAAAFLDYLFSKPTQVKLVTDLGFAPAPIQISVSDLPGIDPRAARYIEELGMAAQANHVGYTIWTFWPPKTAEFIRTDAIEKVWAGKLSTDEFLQATQKVFDPELAAGEVPPLP